MATEYSKGIIIEFTRENGVTTRRMVRGYTFYQMETNMKANFSIMFIMALGNTRGKTGVHIKESGKVERSTAWGSCRIYKMVKSKKEYGRMINSLELNEFLYK